MASSIQTTAGEGIGPAEQAARERWHTPLHRPRLAFRRWRRSRPFWGGLWSILGGLIIMAGPATAFKAILVAGQVVWMGILVGVLVWAFGLFLWFAPSQRQVVSVLIVVLALASFISSDLGGFFIGMLLAIVGGAMGFAWVPAKIKKTKTRKVAASTESNPEASQPTFRAEWPAAPSAPQVDPSQPLT